MTAELRAIENMRSKAAALAARFQPSDKPIVPLLERKAMEKRPIKIIIEDGAARRPRSVSLEEAFPKPQPTP